MTPGYRMAEESVAAALRAGLADIKAAYTADAIDALLAQVYVNVPAPARAEVKAWLAGNAPRIIFGYPLDATVLPCWAILIDPDEQTFDYVGDAANDYDDDDPDPDAIEQELSAHGILTAERWRSTVGIITHAENADLVRYLYHLARFILSRARQALSDDYPYERRMSGRDLQPISVGGESGGRVAFRRVLQITLEGDHTYRVPVPGEPITSDASLPAAEASNA